MLSLFGQQTPGSPAHQSIWNSAPVTWAYAILALSLIGWTAYKSYTAGMFWLAAIQLTLAVATFITAVPAMLKEEHERASQRSMTAYCMSLCFDLLRLR